MRTRCIRKRVGRARLHGLLLKGPLGDAKAWLHVRADVSVFNMDDIIIVPVNNWGSSSTMKREAWRACVDSIGQGD